MNRSAATSIRSEALRAIEALSAILSVASHGCDEAETGRLHKQVGLIIGQIQMGILEPVVTQHPELDELP
jgi:hypothetical protein